MDLLNKMQEPNIFSEREQEVIRYLLMNPSENLTIRQLAERTYTSNATIVRMCQKLGYDGYRQFKVEFIKEMESRKYRIETVDYSQPFRDSESVQDIICNMATLYRESTDLFLQKLDGKTVTQISKVILEARRIYIYAIGDSMITARAFANKLLKLDIYPILVYEFNEGNVLSYNVTNKDCNVIKIIVSMAKKRAHLLYTKQVGGLFHVFMDFSIIDYGYFPIRFHVPNVSKM